MDIKNEDRAEWAAHGLDAYGMAKEQRADYNEPEDMAADMIADLLHLISSHGGDPAKALRVAEMNYQAEMEEEHAAI